MWGKICACQSHTQNATEHVQCTGLGWWESWDTDWQQTTVSANKRQAKNVSTNDRLCVGACHQLDNWEWRFQKSVIWNNSIPASVQWLSAGQWRPPESRGCQALTPRSWLDRRWRRWCAWRGTGRRTSYASDTRRPHGSPSADCAPTGNLHLYQRWGHPPLSRDGGWCCSNCIWKNIWKQGKISEKKQFTFCWTVLERNVRGLHCVTLGRCCRSSHGSSQQQYHWCRDEESL